jgi:hypothetical protein
MLILLYFSATKYACIRSGKLVDISFASKLVDISAKGEVVPMDLKKIGFR